MNYEGTEVEAVLNKDDWHAHNLKGKAFETRMDRLGEAAKKADSPEEAQRISTLRRQTIDYYNKYKHTSHKS